MNQLDPYRAPQSELQDERADGAVPGSMLKAVLIGFGIWILLFMVAGVTSMTMMAGVASGTTDKSLAQSVHLGMTLFSNFLPFLVCTRIARKREWQAGLILYAVRMTVMLAFQLLALHLGPNLSSAYLIVQAQILGAALLGALIGFWYNRRAARRSAQFGQYGNDR